MKSLAVLYAGAAILLFAAPLNAQAPIIDAGVYVYDGGKPMEVDRHSTPFAVDWNNDGAKDLLVGQFTYGWIWLFLNQGTDLNPVFNGGTKVLSNGTPITTTYG